MQCEYLLPDPEIKLKLWDSIVSEDCKDVELKIQGFWQRQHIDLLMPYIEKYYGCLESIVATRDE